MAETGWYIMNRLQYYPHEAARHTAALKETLGRACRSVFTEANIVCRVEAGPWYRRRPSELMRVTVFQRTGCCRRKPVCTLEVERPRTKTGLYDYTVARALFLDWEQHAGNTRLVGHLHRQCPFLPEIEVTLAYDLRDHA